MATQPLLPIYHWLRGDGVGGSVPVNPPQGTYSTAAREAAVATAAFKILSHYLPLDTTLPIKYAESLAAIPDGAEKEAGIVIGEQAADEIILLRAR